LDNKKAVLVTGSQGFIGHGLTKKLTELGHSVFSMDRSLGMEILDETSYGQFAGKSISIVFHLAGLTFVPASWENPSEFYKVNTLGTQKVLDFCSAVGARMIYLSAYIYGVPQYLPIDEKHPVVPNNPYAHTKLLAEELCRFYAKYKSVPVIILRPFNLYGKNQDERFLIPLIVKQARTRHHITVKDITPRRDYLYIDDFIGACVSLLDITSPYSLFNIGYGESYSVKEIIEQVAALSGNAVTWSTENISRPNEIPDTIADISAIKSATGWSPEIPLSEGIKRLL
jgi:nucleoside-diphosphate-sugar epimerase